MIYKNILQTIGQTPVIEVETSPSELYVKLEKFNPGGSVKDRPAYNMIVQAEAAGALRPGMRLIEPTSGNTGIGIAMVAAQKGYAATFVMPASVTKERTALLKAYGAQVVLTDAKQGMRGAVAYATERAQGADYFMPSQFENDHNKWAHKTTADEIWADFGDSLSVVVCSTGSGGTVSGNGFFLKQKNPRLHVVAIEPVSSPVLSGGAAGKHKIPGMGPGFIPKILDRGVIDEIIGVHETDAYAAMRHLAQCHGILCGPSSGAVFATLQALSRRPQYHGKKLLGILPDTGERYLSGDFF